MTSLTLKNSIPSYTSHASFRSESMDTANESHRELGSTSGNDDWDCLADFCLTIAHPPISCYEFNSAINSLWSWSTSTPNFQIMRQHDCFNSLIYATFFGWHKKQFSALSNINFIVQSKNKLQIVQFGGKSLLGRIVVHVTAHIGISILVNFNLNKLQFSRHATHDRPRPLTSSSIFHSSSFPNISSLKLSQSFVSFCKSFVRLSFVRCDSSSWARNWAFWAINWSQLKR